MECSFPFEGLHFPDGLAKAGAAVDEQDAGSAFERAVLPHLDEARAVARYVLRDEYDAQDAVQDAVVRALRYYDSRRVTDVRAWLLTIVRRCCFARKSRRDSERIAADAPDLFAIPDPAPGPEAAASASALREAVAAAIDSLPSCHRQIVLLREVQQLSYDEISRVVGVPVGTVMSRLSRARRRLQHKLGFLFRTD